MSIIDNARSDLVAAINVLTRRWSATTDENEKKVIDEAIDDLNDKISFLAQAQLLQAAQAIAAATDELEKVVASARTGPFDSFLSEIEGSIKRLNQVQSQMHTSESLPSADVATEAAPPQAAAASVVPAGMAKPINSQSFVELKKEYEDYYAACRPLPDKKKNIDYYVSRLRKNQALYTAVGADLNIPWEFIGVIHGLEGGFDFTTHLHNGDPLTTRTVNVPAGRPPTGAPPFSWKESAEDALLCEGFNHETDWSISRMLFLWEKYNGFGYRNLGIPTPYLWSFSSLYSKGKFTSDGHFDPSAVSKQCGAAVMLKALRS